MNQRKKTNKIFSQKSFQELGFFFEKKHEDFFFGHFI